MESNAIRLTNRTAIALRRQAKRTRNAYFVMGAVGTLLLLALATSIDALAVGVTFAFLQVNIVSAITIIGCTTFVISLAGVYVGNVFGARYKSRAELTGGVILVLIGLKILLEHLGIVNF